MDLETRCDSRGAKFPAGKRPRQHHGPQIRALEPLTCFDIPPVAGPMERVFFLFGGKGSERNATHDPIVRTPIGRPPLSLFVRLP